MMLFNFLLSFFGLFVGFRTADFLIMNQLVSIRFKTWLHFGISLSIFIVEIALRQHLAMNLAILICFCFLPVAIFAIQELQRQRAFERNIVSYLDALLISLQMGRSFRESLKELAQNQRGPGGFYLQELSSLLHFSGKRQDHSRQKLYAEVLREFLEMNTSSHRVLEQVKALRRKIYSEQSFRRKSRQVSLQVRAQAGILSILFTLLFLYTLMSFEFREVQGVLAGAGCLFVVGVLISLRLERSFRWKV